MDRKIIHIDMDAFFASVEQRDNPSLKGTPVIVGGAAEARGVVAAASYEVRAFGVHSAMSTSRALRLCPHATVIRPRHGYYREISDEIMELYAEYTDLIEPLSLDECFLDVTENKKGITYASVIARQLRRKIKEKLDLTASAGVAPNKFIAKIASDFNKPDGLTVVPPESVRHFLEPLPVKRIWGVGKKTAERMQALDIRTIGDLAQVSLEDLQSHFGKSGALFYRLARGEDDRPVQTDTTRKQVSQETTFPEDIVDLGFLRGTLERLSERVAGALTRKELQGSTIMLKLRYDTFETITRSHTLPFPTAGADVIAEEGARLLSATEAGKRPVRLIGIGISNLIHVQEIRQLLLFDPHGY